MTEFIDPDDRDLSILCVAELRKVYAFYRRAALYGMSRKALSAHILAFRPITPVEWVEAVKSARTECARCTNGTYCWGAVVNGRPTHSGECFQCGGKGYQDMSDFRRNRGYNRYAIQRAFAGCETWND